MTTENGSSGSADGGWSRAKIRIGAIIWFLAAIGVLLALPVLLDIAWWSILIVAAVALVLALPLTWLFRLIVRSTRRHGFGHSFLKTAIGTFAVLAILIALPIYVLAGITAIRPMTVPLATLSNGSKTVMFQGMMHVGSEGFYKSVVYDLEKALTEDYVLYYEGVKADPEGDKWFSDTLAGGGDLSTNYTQLGNICGLQFQLDYFGLLEADMNAHPERHVTADVSTADMKREYERLIAADPAFAAAVAAEKRPAPTTDDSQSNGGGGVSGLFDLFSSATPGQRSLVGVACRGWVSWMLSQAAAPSTLDPIIVDYRNRNLADQIINGPDKIYITYGAHHLPGIIDLLKANDPAWELGSIKWSRVIDTPEELEGELN